MILPVLAAGSLRRPWPSLSSQFEQQSGIKVAAQFGPAGELRARVESGEACSLFASANMAHPQALWEQGKALEVQRFAGNRLCLAVAAHCAEPDWLSLLGNPMLRLATSTPGSDPCGDYTWQFFAQIQARYGIALQQRAMPLVGGARSENIPPGQLAAAWLFRSDKADLFIGYGSYAGALRQEGIRVLAIPPTCNVRADYGLALCEERARPLLEFLLSPEAKAILRQFGFAP